MALPLNDINKSLPLIIREWFRCSSRKDHLASFVNERLEEGRWYSRLEVVGTSPNKETLRLLNLLMAMLSPEDKVLVRIPFFLPSLT